MADIIQAQIIDEEIVMPSADPVAHNMPGGGAVESVNGKTGAVVLTAGDVGAVATETFNAAIEGKQDKLAAGTGAEIKDGVLSAATLGITGAAVGQIARITAVDSDGKPTAWEPVDMASGYIKPDSGIPKSDLSNEVQDSLSKADTALQEHQDISGKVDKVEGKGLSTEDYTTEEKSKLNGINIDEIKNDITDLQTALIGVSELIGGDA